MHASLSIRVDTDLHTVCLTIDQRSWLVLAITGKRQENAKTRLTGLYHGIRVTSTCIYIVHTYIIRYYPKPEIRSCALSTDVHTVLLIGCCADQFQLILLSGCRAKVRLLSGVTDCMWIVCYDVIPVPNSRL